jgi:hypothetical protein
MAPSQLARYSCTPKSKVQIDYLGEKCIPAFPYEHHVRALSLTLGMDASTPGGHYLGTIIYQIDGAQWDLQRYACFKDPRTACPATGALKTPGDATCVFVNIRSSLRTFLAIPMYQGPLENTCELFICNDLHLSDRHIDRYVYDSSSNTAKMSTKLSERHLQSLQTLLRMARDNATAKEVKC